MVTVSQPLTLAALDAAIAPHFLRVFGALHPQPDASLPDGTGTLVLFGPREPGFWALVTAQPEMRDGAPDPLDRWSKRVIGGLADTVGGTGLFPSDGPPYPPFIGWAVASGRAWRSPVGLLVHDYAGLFLSYRGALAVPQRLDLSPPARTPCDTCADQPCRAACPVGALTPDTYDVPVCKAHLRTPHGHDCLTSGCAARRACPISQQYGRVEAQSAFHMKAFL